MFIKGHIIVILLCYNLTGTAQEIPQDTLGAEVFSSRADSLFQQEQWMEARNNYELALAIVKTDEADLSTNIIHLKVANTLRMEGKFKEATDLYFQTLDGFKKLGAQEKIIQTFAQISVHLSSTDPMNAIAYADSALDMVKRYFADDSLMLATYLFEVADRHRTAVKYAESIHRYAEVLQILADLSKTDSFLLFNTHFRLGGVLCRLDRREESLDQYRKAEYLLLEKYGHNQKLLRNFYQDVAFLLEDVGDFEQALDYRKRYCEYFFSKKDSTSFEVSRAMNNLGLTYERRGDYHEAKFWYEKVLKNNQRIYGATSIYTGFLLNNVGNIYKHLGNYEEALPLLEKAYTIFRDYFGKDHVYPANVSSNIGNTYNLMGYPERALPYNKAALSIRRTKLGPYHEDLARDYQLMGDIYTNLKVYDQAINYYDSAAQATKYNPEIGHGSVISHHRLNQALESKARLYSLLYQNSGDLEYLKSGSEVYLMIDDLTDYVRSSYKSEGSKRYLLNKRRDFYLDAVTNYTILFEQTNNHHYLDEAFRFSEKTRSILLFEALLSSKAENFGTIPKELRLEIADLKQKNLQLEKELFEFGQKNMSDSLSHLHNLENQLFASQNDHRKLMNSVASDYPAYFNLKYKLATQSMEDAQAKLSADQVFLEFLVGKDRITVFIITDQERTAHQILLDFPLRQWIWDFRQSIYGYALSNRKSHELFDSLQSVYFERAIDLYDKLLRPVETYFKDKSTLILSPDQELNYLPFDALLFQAPENSRNFKTLPYLIQQFAIHYVPSVTLWDEMKNRKSLAVSSKILAFAPQFEQSPSYSSLDESRASLGTLKYNEWEVTKISDIFPVKSYLGKKAGLDQFLSSASDYSVIHLATHGKANDLEGDFSYLAFYNDSIESTPALFYAADIYNLNLNAEMVVLSACETGIGELQKGEGIISLARAFSYAGAKSIITTLWAVNDQATSELMLFFYKNLRNRKSKAEALRNAKLQYLKQIMDPIEAHPFYWAGMISMGDLNQLTVHFLSNRSILMLSGGLLIILLLVILRGAKRKI